MGEELTDPLPFPAVLTVSAYWFRVKVAVTDLGESIVGTQDPAPAQSPLQEVKLEPAPGVGVSVTAVPAS